MFEQVQYIIAKAIVVLVAIVMVSAEIAIRSVAFVACTFLFVVCAIFSPVIDKIDNFEVVADFINWGMRPKISWTQKAIKTYKSTLGC